MRGTLARIGGKLVVTDPKTAKSRRTLPLSPSVVAMLQAHRKRQGVERRRAGSVWAAGSDFVFTTETGTPVEPRNIFRAVSNAADNAALKGVGVHTLPDALCLFPRPL